MTQRDYGKIIESVVGNLLISHTDTDFTDQEVNMEILRLLTQLNSAARFLVSSTVK